VNNGGYLEDLYNVLVGIFKKTPEISRNIRVLFIYLLLVKFI